MIILSIIGLIYLIGIPFGWHNTKKKILKWRKSFGYQDERTPYFECIFGSLFWFTTFGD